MKRKAFTLSYDNKLLREIDNNEGQFTSEEKAYAMQAEHGGSKGRFKSKGQLLRELPKHTLGPKLSLFHDNISQLLSDLEFKVDIIDMWKNACK